MCYEALKGILEQTFVAISTRSSTSSILIHNSLCRDFHDLLMVIHKFSALAQSNSMRLTVAFKVADGAG